MNWEVVAIRIKSVTTLLAGIFGFGLIGYALWGLYGVYSDVHTARNLIPSHEFEGLFIGAGETYILLLGAGIAIVLIVTR